MSAPPPARRLLLTGRVQGVGFRYFTRKAAQELGVVGTVANLPDGRVEIEAAGDPAAVEELARRVRQGPRFAEVREVVEEEIAEPPPWEDFRVVHK
jgi:acylphosphatase